MKQLQEDAIIRIVLMEILTSQKRGRFSAICQFDGYFAIRVENLHNSHDFLRLQNANAAWTLLKNPSFSGRLPVQCHISHKNGHICEYATIICPSGGREDSATSDKLAGVKFESSQTLQGLIWHGGG